MAQQLRGDALTELYFDDLTRANRIHLQGALAGYGLYSGPVNGDFNRATLRAIEYLSALLAWETRGWTSGYDIGHPQGMSMFLDDVFSGRMLEVFPDRTEDLSDRIR